MENIEIRNKNKTKIQQMDSLAHEFQMCYFILIINLAVMCYKFDIITISCFKYEKEIPENLHLLPKDATWSKRTVTV